MHRATGWCEGCARTLGEIADWSNLGDGEKLIVWKRLASRREQLAALIALPPALLD